MIFSCTIISNINFFNLFLLKFHKKTTFFLILSTKNTRFYDRVMFVNKPADTPPGAHRQRYPYLNKLFTCLDTGRVLWYNAKNGLYDKIRPENEAKQRDKSEKPALTGRPGKSRACGSAASFPDKSRFPLPAPSRKTGPEERYFRRDRQLPRTDTRKQAMN